MSPTTQFLINHGLPLLFAAVFLEQMGLPLPALPWLLAAGALAAAGKFNVSLGLGVTVMACLAADAIWFYLGRYRGNQLLALLCRISLEPDSCVRRTQNVFTKYGMRGVFVAKFVPGMGTVAPPLAGMSGISATRFLSVDAAGSLLYGGCLLGFGYLFSHQIDQIGAAIAHIGGSALTLIAGFAAVYIAYKYWQRQHLLHELRMARITVAELRDMLDTGKTPLIFDLRSSAALEEDPVLIQGAIHLSVDDIEKRLSTFPRDQDIVVYCSCPNEVSSARLALQLQRKGFTRVRPLLGGIDAWREQNYPTQPRVAAAARVVVTASPSPEPAPGNTAKNSSVKTGDSSVHWDLSAQPDREHTKPSTAAP
jgi:membrane protein DedA with SNARE-associated domain/rhodanese-related sulfurtransferase